jgi:hypothetical protein
MARADAAGVAEYMVAVGKSLARKGSARSGNFVRSDPMFLAPWPGAGSLSGLFRGRCVQGLAARSLSDFWATMKFQMLFAVSSPPECAHFFP